MELIDKAETCQNCGAKHNGMFYVCYQCFDCETEAEYNERSKLKEPIQGEGEKTDD